MKTVQIIIAALAASLFLSACKDAADQGAGAQASAESPVSIAAIAAEASGFTLGSAISARAVYVFFDPQCPHCAALWGAAKPLKSQAKFVWIPVALMNKTSEEQGAALLVAQNPVAAMDEHEASMTAQKGGIVPSGNLDAQKAQVAKNTELMKRFGFGSVPTIVAQHAQNGTLVTQEGSMPTPVLAKLLGLDVPAN